MASDGKQPGEGRVIRLGENQLAALLADRQQRLESRLDDWLIKELSGWSAIALGARQARLAWILQQGTAFQMQSEADFAVFAFLFAALGDSARQFATHPDIAALKDWDSAHPGAILRELHRLADHFYTAATP